LNIKTSIIFFLTLLVIAGCNSAKNDLPSDFEVKYSMKNGLFRTQGSIEINQGTLYLSYVDSQKNLNLNESYTLTAGDAASIYKYMNSIDFINMKAPESGTTPDAPYMVINGAYSGKTNEISFGAAKVQPDELLKLKQKLFELSSKYSSDNWKKTASF